MFTIGARDYNVKISENPLESEEPGCVRWGECQFRHRLLVLSCDCPPADRLPTLRHEIAEALLVEVGQPGNKEQWCDFAAHVAAICDKGMKTAGGEFNLLRLKPGEVLAAFGTNRILSTRNRYCPHEGCGGTIAGGDVKYAPANGYGQAAVRVSWDACPVCDRPWWHVEAATPQGLPTGQVIDYQGKSESDAA